MIIVMTKQRIIKVADNLFHKDLIEGFQFTAGNWSKAIAEKKHMNLICSINKTKSNSVIDLSESELCKAIELYLFGKTSPETSINNINKLQEQFKELNYEVDSMKDVLGEWYWFRVKCNSEEIPFHVEILKNKLNKFFS